MAAALLAGIDLSSKRIDAALIPLDPSDGSDAPAVTLRSFEMPTWRRETTPAFRTVERCRVVRDAMRELLGDVRTESTANAIGLCRGRTLEESSHYGGYVRCWNPGTHIVPVGNRLVSLCDSHGPKDVGPPPWEKHEVVHVCVETPIGSRSRSTVLWELYGAILASIPSHIERDTIRAIEWHDLIWPPESEGRAAADRNPNWKLASIWQARLETGVEMDEHQAEAYLIARACRERLDRAVAA